jgi:hypothetical protein
MLAVIIFLGGVDICSYFFVSDIIQDVCNTSCFLTCRGRYLTSAHLFIRFDERHCDRDKLNLLSLIVATDPSLQIRKS